MLFLLGDHITFLFSIKNLTFYSKVEASSCPIVELETPSSLPTWPHALAVSLGWLSIHVERKTANFLWTPFAPELSAVWWPSPLVSFPMSLFRYQILPATNYSSFKKPVDMFSRMWLSCSEWYVRPLIDSSCLNNRWFSSRSSILASFFCYFACEIRRLTKYRLDDACDVFASKIRYRALYLLNETSLSVSISSSWSGRSCKVIWKIICSDWLSQWSVLSFILRLVVF